MKTSKLDNIHNYHIKRWNYEIKRQSYENEDNDEVTIMAVKIIRQKSDFFFCHRIILTFYLQIKFVSQL